MYVEGLAHSKLSISSFCDENVSIYPGFLPLETTLLWANFFIRREFFFFQMISSGSIPDHRTTESIPYHLDVLILYLLKHNIYIDFVNLSEIHKKIKKFL